MKNVLLIIPMLFLFACANTATKKSIVQKDTVATTIIRQSGDSVLVDLNISNDTVNVKLHKEKGQKVYLSFLASDFEKLRGLITPIGSDANIRFNQIVMPDGTSDGPFGLEIDYDLELKGNYTFIIGESLMAGDAWAGDFEVKLILSK